MSVGTNLSTVIGGVDVKDARTRGALVHSLYDGVFATVMLGIVETFGVAAALTLGVSTVAIALLGPLPVWLGTLAQLLLRQKVVGRTRKPWVVAAVRLQATTLLLMSLVGWVGSPWAAILYVAAFILYGASNASVGHLWMSWISDVCPTSILGRHMAWRSGIFAIVQLLTTAVAGWFARGFTNDTAPWSLYALSFMIAAAARLSSSECIRAQYEPPIGARILAEPFRPSVPLARFARAVAFLNGSALMAGPFFAVWFLRDLGFSYFEFAIASACTVAGQVVATRFAGHWVDSLGAATLLRIGAVLSVFIPVPYLVLESPGWIWLLNFWSGIVWACINLAAFKYLVQAARGGPERSGFVYANIWLTSSMLVMGLAGGLLAPHLPCWFAWPLQTLFLMSALLRLTVVLVYFTRLLELEPTERARSAGPGRLFQIFRWGGPGSTQV